MPVERQDPYPNFRFKVEFVGGPGKDSFQAGFQEISGLSNEITIAEYRNGNEVLNHVRKVAMLNKKSDVTFKRGHTASSYYYAWLKAVRDGSRERHTIRVEMFNELGNQVVSTWTLVDTIIMKITWPTFNGKGGTDLAIEEIVVSVGDILWS